MNRQNKFFLFLFIYFALTHLSTACFFNNNSNALTGAAIGGLAGGRKGAGIGFATGVGLDLVSSAANRNRRDYYYDEEPYESRSELRRTIQILKKENRELQRQIDMLSRKLDDCKRRLKKRS